MADFVRSDLEFILRQIQIAEANAAGADLRSLLPNDEVPWGLRTVDGTLNNLVPTQSEFGAADNAFPRLVDPVFRTAEAGTSYAQTSGTVIDSQPRVISNLIVDLTPNNPAAAAAAAQNPGAQLTTSPGLDGIFGTADDTPVFFIPNVTPDVGLSAPFNSWMTFFGQFFDHGLDLVTKGGNGFVFVPLQPDDPLFVPGSPTNFMIETRATLLPGPDGILGTTDDIHEQQNTTTPFVDQNQTYTSHPAHQVFLRAYTMVDLPGDGLGPVSVNTGKLIENRDLGADGRFGTADDIPIGGMATWAVVKAQARDLLGIQLSDYDVVNVPLVRVDPYGNFIPGTHGFAQLIVGLGPDGLAQTADDVLVEGNPTAPISPLSVGALRTDHQFLIDIAHSANPFDDFGHPLLPDADDVINSTPPAPGFYDNELLNAHYIAGDGRVNENIGLTAVHAIFHSEHNRLAEETKSILLTDAAQTGDVSFLNQWLLVPVTAVPADPSTLVWNGERLFQAARFGTEMQYQHLVFEEFARTVQPAVDEFLAPNGYDTTIDPSIFAEFAHAVFRLGHSMLVETIDRFDINFNVVPSDPAHPDQQLGLIAAFLNPLAYAASGVTPTQATGAIVRGLTREVGNEIDEFVTEAVRNNLLGLPLDLAVLNIARGRDTGLPSLNAARRKFYAMASDSQLTPYSSWADFAQHLKHPESLINFIAAYGTHPTITAATTLADKRAAAADLVFGGATAPADRLDFLYSTGAWTSNAGADGILRTVDDVTTTGLDQVDLWVGGLAEEIMPFGGVLGSTFNFVFETQLENLQNGDRFYYLSRTAGLHFGVELEQNSFAKLVMNNTDVTHLPAAIFSTPTFILEVNQARQFNAGLGNADPVSVGPFAALIPLVIRDNPTTTGPDTNYLQYTGEDHVVLGGTPGNDIILSGIGDDTLYGDEGNDRLDGGAGNDSVFGGAGDDIITSGGGNDTIQGGAGNDVITEGHSLLPLDLGNLILGGDGKDFIAMSDDISLIFGGQGDDFILSGIPLKFGQGAKTNLAPTGNEGDDWIEKGTQDGAPGDNFSPFLLDDVAGNDIFLGGGGFDEFIGEGGDDIFVGSDAQDKMDGMSGFDWATYKNDRFGVTVDMRLPIFAPAHGNPATPGAVGGVGQSPDGILDRFAEVEGLSGSKFGDILKGDDQTADIIATVTAKGSVLTNISLISGLQDFLGASVTQFGTGNIILGGDGSDLIEGNGGDDLIDGDKWLNVRISVHANVDGTGPEIASFDSMEPLVPLMLNRTYNPGQLVATREIMPGRGGFDTANYAGHLGDYTVDVNNNGTPLDFSDDIVTVADNVAGRDGTDRLTHIERLQFSPDPTAVTPAGLTGRVVLVPGLNNEPVGQLTINDFVTNTPDTTPTEGQLLKVAIAANGTIIGVTDANNPGGTISNATYVWQVERAPGTGVFEDIVLKPGGIVVGFPTADGTTFLVDPALGLAGLSLRVKAVYADAHGVTEQVFSAPTAPVIAVPVAPVTTPTFVDHTQTSGGLGVHFIRGDLNFILDQIKIAERNAAGEPLINLVGNVRSPQGLRTVDGSFNNLVNFGNVPNQTQFGAADTIFPRLTNPLFRKAQPVTVDLDGPGGQAVGDPTSYTQTSGFVFDSQPRTISNLIVDQTPNNPAAVAAQAQNPGSQLVTSPGLDGLFGTADDHQVYFIPNVAPDAGLSAPFDAWMTFFGQFFDHGLDLVTKGGNGTVFVPLQPDDPLFVPGSPTNFMLETRATMRPGPDGILGTADDIHENENTTTPFVDQNQTYTSHPSHQVFLRAYQFDAAGHPVNTGKLIENRSAGLDGQFFTADDVLIGGMATWAVVKAQAAKLLGVQLTDYDVSNVPLVRVDPYGNFIPGANGFAQIIIGLGADGMAQTADDVLLAGNPAANGGLGVSIPVTAPRTGHQFLIDIAHSANPFDDFGHPLLPDPDTLTGNTPGAGFYDNELLNAHYIAGDGRVNENIGLTAVHAIFHSEHNRLVDQVKQTMLIAEADTPGYINEWLAPGFEFTPGMTADQVQWNGERLFQVAKFGTEMQYQHLVFEEFARTVQPLVDPFFAPTQVYDVNINPAIVAEFAHTVYRFGHSMLTETVDRFDPDFNAVVADPLHPTNAQQLGLIAAFLNPLAYAASGPTPAQATGAIVRGVTREVGNEIDEFVTEALRNNLVGLPLDLAVLNLARGRDTGIPSLNASRREFYAATSDSELKPYTSWADFVQHLKHPESLINFIAAYGTHSTITGATTMVAKRAAATAIVLGGAGAPADRLDFLNSTGTWANTNPARPKDFDGVTTTGLGSIDFWIGGLAEAQTPFGGLLGSTFNFVFENQLEKLQDGDRFYYLERTAGMNFNSELENNTFSKLIMANTDATHLSALVFKAAAFTFEVDPTKQFTGLGVDGRADPVNVGPFATLLPLVIRDNPMTVGPDTNYLQYTGEDHVVLGGTAGNDIIRSSIGDDTVYGDDGNDRLDGGDGNDQITGGAGDDIITDTGGDDVIHGLDGNDVIQGGNGANLLIGGFGQDFIITGEDASEAIGGPGNDFILGSKANEFAFGNEGDDWIERGTSDGAAGDNFDPIGAEPVKGNDVILGDGGPDNVDGEGGDDIYVGTASEADRFIGFGGFDWATYKNEALGVTIGLEPGLRFFDQPVMPGSNASVLSRLDLVEGLSGSAHDDYLVGDNSDAAAIAVAGDGGSVLTNPGLIHGLQDFLNTMLGTPTTPVVTSFGGGNIIFGGSGSDFIRGNGGDDLIDGDAWLNVRISVRATVDANHDGIADRDANGELVGVEITSADSMTQLVDAMVAGVYNPGQLQTVREILYAPTANFDTAVFSGPAANYTVVQQPNGTVVVTDNVGTDGVDTLRHIERIQFSDQAFVLGGLNHAPVGLLTISDPTPTENQLLTVSIAGVTDADNVRPGNASGAITGPVSYFWQEEETPGSGVFTDIMFFQAGETGRAEGTTFTPVDGPSLIVAPQVGLALRVRAVYKDANDVLEEVFSAPTAPVANVNDTPVGTVLISDTTPTEGHPLTAINAFTDADGLTTAVFTYQWFRNNLATPVSAATTSTTYTPVQADVGQRLQVQVTYTDDNGTTETVLSALTGGVGDLIIGTAAAETLTGTAFDDDIQGLGGADTINAGTGDDQITGGAGADILNGGDGNDTFNYTIGNGADTVNGGLGTDTLAITGTAAADTLNVVFNGTAFTSVAGGTVTGVETATADLLGGTDTLNYGAASAAVTVNLGAGTASGFSSIANIENVSGGNGADRFIATVGDGNNNYNGGGGVDTYDLSLTTAGATVTTTSATSADIGTDTLTAIENITGSQGNDSLTVNGGVNVIDGQGGDDTIHAGGGNDTVSGGDGNDTFTYTMGDGADTMDGGAGLDTLRITGLAGNDTLNVVFNGTSLTSVAGGTVTNVEVVTANLDGGTDTVSYTGTTADVKVNLTSGSASGFAPINGIAGIDNVTGGAGNDTLTGDVNANLLNGGDGNDFLTGGAGNDTLNGQAGDDRFSATVGDGNDNYIGGAGSDTYDLSLTSAGATVTGATATSAQTGTDTLATIENIIGSQGDDTITFGNPDNVLDGQGGNDLINAGGGNDTLLGGLGNDTLNGEAGNDTLNGGDGDDTLNGGANAAGGSDTLTGGLGTDRFVFGAIIAEAGNGAGARDVITDFEGAGVAGGDVIDVNAIDANTGVGGNQNFNFIGTAAFTAAGQLRYVQVGGITLLEGNVNAALGADFQIELTGTHNLLAGDFTL